MKFKSLGYCFVQGLKNIGRNRMFSLASVATMTLCIFLFGLLYSVSSNINYMVENMSESLCIKVFFDENITEEREKSIGNTIKDYEGVTVVHYTSKEEAWANYKELYFGDYQDLADIYENDNPLANSASYEVYFKDASMQAELVTKIKALDGVRIVNSSESASDGLMETHGLVSLISVVVLVILLAITLFLINNTISIGISVRSEEISIMRLLGARNGFIRAPFVVEGVILGVVGAVLPIAIVYGLYDYVESYIISKFSFLSNILTFQPVSEIFKIFVPVAIILGLGLGLLGSVISLAKHLRN